MTFLARLELATAMARAGDYRSAIVRATGLTADQVGAIVEKVRAVKPQAKADVTQMEMFEQ